MKKHLFHLFLVVAISFSARIAWGQFNIDAGSTNYIQDFNTLTSGTWTNNTTPITGWYTRTTATASITTYGANTGSTTTAGLYAFGVAGTNPLTDRALGFSTSNTFTGTASSGLNYMGWRLKNNTGSEIISLTITYTGEQWRKDNTVNQNLNVDYQIGSTVTDVIAGTWTNISALTFTSPIITSGGTALDGNAIANRVTNITTTITISIAAGDEIMIRWTDLNDASTDHQLAIDDVTINATVAATPGTSTITLGAATEPASFSSLLNTQGAAVINFDFTLLDDGASPSTDALATQLSQLRFRQGTGNDITDWTVALLGAELNDGTNTLTGTINATNITFSSIPTGSGQLGHIADNATKTYTLKVWLKTDVGILKTSIDGSNFVFQVINADFTITGSQLIASQDVNSGATNNAVGVTSTVLAFVQNTSNTDLNNNMSPSPSVSANDANGNRDRDFTASVSITSTGTLNNSPQIVTASIGLATFTIVHSATAIGRTLTASSGSLTNITSSTFNINALTNATLIHWSSTSSNAWLTPANWTGGTVPTSIQVAQFGANTVAANNFGINLNTAGGTQNLGAIELESTRTAGVNIGNSSGLNGVLNLNGVAVNSIGNTIIRNNSSHALSLQNNVSGINTMGVVLNNATNNIVQIDGTGGVIISSIISGANPITKAGSGSGILQLTGANTYTGLTTVSAGTLQLNRIGGTTIPITNNASINGGTLKVSTNQTLNNLVLTSGNLTIDASVTLTINGTLTLNGGTITNNGSIAYGGSSTLIYNTSDTRTATSEWPSSSPPTNITLQGGSIITLPGNRTIQNLTLTSGVLAIGANTLTLNGAITGSGTLSGSATSDLTIGGSAGTILFTSGARTIRNLTIGTGSSTSLTLGSDLDITPLGGIIFNAAGSKTLTTTGRVLTLKSTSAGTAYIGNINGATITGNITAERFVSNSGRRWRFFASPFTNATFEDIRQEVYITGAGIGNTAGTLNSNGFDATLSNQPSVYSYTESTAGSINLGWTALTNSTSSLSNQTIVAGKGYRIFIRGDRSDIARLTGANLTSISVTVNAIGTINSGSIIMPVTYTANSGQANDGWNLLGNPYPCAFDWNAFRDNNVGITNIDSIIYIFDATSGSYKSYNSNSGGSLTDGIIPQGASFWVKANAAAPALTLTEQFKTTAAPIALFKHTTVDELKLVLSRDSVTSDIFILAHHAASTKHKDAFDITKLAGEINLMSKGNDGIDLTYDARPIITLNDTVNIVVSGGNNTYTISLNSLPTSSGKHYYLVDKKLANTTLLTTNYTYTYSTSSIDSSSFGNRFQLIISSSSALPVLFQQFTATKQQHTVLLSWTTASEMNNNYFDAEKSMDGKNWQTVSTIKAAGNSNTTRHYQTIDEFPNTQTVTYYRIKQVDFDNHISYTQIQPVSFVEDNLMHMQLQPNPAIDRVDIISTTTIQKVVITDCNGKQVMEIHQPYFTIATLPSGMYFVKITTINGAIVYQKLLKN